MSADEKTIRAQERLATLKALHEKGYNTPQPMWDEAEAVIRESDAAAAGKFRVTRAQLADGVWSYQNSDRLKAAQRDGTLEIVD